MAAWSTHAAEGEKVQALELVPGEAHVILHINDMTGLKKAAAASDFGTLWTEAETQAFVGPAWKSVLEGYETQRKENPALPALDDLLKAVPADVAATLTLGAGGAPTVAVALRIGDFDAAKRILGPLTGGNLDEGQLVQMGPAGGPAMVYEKGFLLFSTHGPELEKMRARAADKAQRTVGVAAQAPGFIAAKKLLGGAGHITLFASVPELLKLGLAQAPPNELPMVEKILAGYGANGIKGIAMQIGSRDTVFAADLAVTFDGEPKGLLALGLNTKPLSADALAVVPAEAMFCSAARTDLNAIWGGVRQALPEEILASVVEGLAQLREVTGLDLEKDLLPVLGDHWVTYDVGGTELMGLLPSLSVAVSLKDSAKASQVLNTLLAKAEEMIKQELEQGGMRMGPEFELRKVKFGQTEVRYLNITAMAFSPAVAIVKDRLFVTFSLQGMRRVLKHLEGGKDLTTAPGFKAALERVTGKPLDLTALPAQFTYASPGKDASIYASVAQLAQMVTGIVRMQMKMPRWLGDAPDPNQELVHSILKGFDFALFPSGEIIYKHMRPTASVLVKSDGGMVFRSDLGVPSSGGLLSGQGNVMMIPVVAAIAIPNLLRSRMAANESAAIACCKAYAEAQDVYRRTDWDGDGILEYSQNITGANSLFEKNEGTGDVTLVDRAFADAEMRKTAKELDPKDIPEPTAAETEAFKQALAKLSSEDFGERETASKELEKLGKGVIKLLDLTHKENKDAEVQQRCKALTDKLKLDLAREKGLVTSKAKAPKAGYYFKVLTKQGAGAPGGAKSYVNGGNMTLGYALLAWPATYDKTARNTFLINNSGTVYQQELGAKTPQLCEQMDAYDPAGWVVTE